MIDRVKATRIILLAVVMGAAVGIRAKVEAAPPEPTVRIEPARLDVLPNEDFELRLMINDVEDLAGFEFRMAYDPSVMEVTDATTGDLVGTTDRLVIPVEPQIGEEGSVAFGALSVGQEPGANGSGLLATVACRALEAGETSLRLEKVEVFNTTPELLSVRVEDGQVTVKDTDAREAEPSDGSPRATPWGWIAAAVVVVAVSGGAAFTLLRGKRRKTSNADSS